MTCYVAGWPSSFSAATSRRGAEQQPVFAAELRRALVTDAESGRGCVESLAQHQPPCLLEAQPLLVPERAQRRHALEVEVERRRAHPHLPRQRLDLERVRETVLQPPDCPSDPVGRGAGRGDLTQ